jgi:hypothetical protein
MIRYALIVSLLLLGCSPAPDPAAPPAAENKQAVDNAPPDGAPQPAKLEALQAAHDWQYEPGDKLNAAWNEGVKAQLGKLSRSEIIGAINAAGFECTYGEAHEDYPDPAAVCTRSFATRRCQMDWEITSTADKGMVDEVDGSFKRDCVGTADDWPEPIKSAIDDQLAPITPPAVPPN